jgi:signal peptidase II
VLAGLALFFLALDQGSKWLVRQNLAVGAAWAPIPALSKVFTFTHVQNLVGILVLYPRIPAGQWPLRLAAALILAGDLGNIIDRLRTTVLFSQVTGSIWLALPQAYVTDFFDFKIWPVWNVADMCVVTGVAIVAWMLWRVDQAERADEPVAHDQ